MRVSIKAATPDAMRVIFMRSLDVAQTLCDAGRTVELVQELMSSQGPRTARWEMVPTACVPKALGS